MAMAKGQKARAIGISSPPPTSKDLPNEILRLVFDYLDSDKHTLASCMRVSPTWNAVTAPILYHTVKVVYPNREVGFTSRPSSKGSNPFYIPAKKKWVTRTSKVSSKEKNLELIRHVTFGHHDGRQCEEAMRTLHQSSIRRLSLDSVTFAHDRDDPYGGFVPHWYDNGTNHCGCQVGRKLDAKRVILSDSTPLWLRSPIRAAELICVFAWDAERLEIGRKSLYKTCVACSAKSVYIYKPLPDGRYYSKNQLEADGLPKDYCQYFDLLERIAQHMWELPDSREVVVVGLERVNRAHGQSRVDLAAHLQKYVTDRKPDNLPDDRPSDVDLRLMTLGEYIRGNDCTGIFTEEEYVKWMADEDEDVKSA